MIEKPMLRFCLIGVFLLFTGAVHAQGSTPAKKLFGNKPLPASLAPRSHGFYSRGCLAGADAMPVNGPAWQAMRLSRNRNWGHPDLVAYLKWLAGQAAAKDGWPGLLVGDMSQPRGGPMLTGHRSHQTGLDADIWLTPMPNRKLSRAERENLSATAIVKPGPHIVYKNVWTDAHFRLIKRAASHKRVQRILVAPGIKKKLCETEKGNRRWLRKIRRRAARRSRRRRPTTVAVRRLPGGIPRSLTPSPRSRPNRPNRARKSPLPVCRPLAALCWGRGTGRTPGRRRQPFPASRCQWKAQLRSRPWRRLNRSPTCRCRLCPGHAPPAGKSVR
jgi:murein endopeptidase